MDWKTRIPALVLWLSLVLSSFEDVKAEKRIVCYYTNWTVYRPGTAKFSPQNINPYLCTHLIYAFGGFTKDNTLKPFDKGADIEKGGYAKFTGLKTYNKDLKTMIAIGGWNEASARFSPMVADSGRRKEFVKNTVKFLRQNHFDGLDLDWEYPAARTGGKPHDKDNYADLVQELRDEFERESSKTGRPRLLLTMAVPAGITWLEKGYDLPRLNDYLDFMNLLTYDYYASTDPSVNHHSPLHSLEEANEYNYDAELTIDFTINYLFKNGVSSDKIVLGIPTYGRSYTLLNEDATDIGSPTAGKGEKGEATREEGYLAYYEICESIAKDDEWEVVQPNPAAMGPYAFRRDQWVGYDDEDIVRVKARYVNEKKLGGIMFWSIDNDDFRGKCHGRPFPLIEAAKEAYLTGETRKSTSVTKTKLSENRKKTRPLRIQGNTIGRKLTGGKRRTTTTEPSISRRRVSPRSNGRINGRSSDVDEEREGGQEDEEEEEEGNAVRAVEKSRPKVRSKHRSRNRSNAGGRRKQQQHSSGEESLSNKLTTPEPPTTPDPGGDFKCEEDGFFPHPRDCKKYYWCLDSGPSGLGIVANQFNCPSGLVFNKAADSCDYPRNVVCPKTKTSDKSSSLSTTRAPITAATSRTTYLHKSTQRTTTPEAESDEEYEYYDDEEIEDEQEVEEEARSTTTAKPLQYKTINRSRPTTTSTTPSTTTIETTTKAYRPTTNRGTSFEDEEDPKVIKELIDLIKKAGGIEQLEKQLHYQEKNSGGNSGKVEENGSSTSATISRSLYERVLNRQATRIAGGFLGPYSTTQSPRDEKNEPGKNARIGFVNGPGGAQFEGLDSIPEVKSLRRTNKPKYVTIERQRQSTSESPNEDDDEIDDEEDDDSTDVASSEDRAVSNAPYQKNSNRRVTSSYVNIRRPRPSTTTSENDVDLKDDDANSDNSDEAEEPVTQRHRVVKEDEPSNLKSRYTNTQRFRSTTSRDSEDDVSQKPLKSEPTTSTTTTTTTTTTTERIVPVTEEISEFPIPSTTAASTIPESPSTEKATSSTSTSPTTTERPSSSEETSTPSISQSTSYDSSLGLVEDSATEILFTTAPASSLSTGSNSETFTRGPSVPAVSQPRPFGFPRRGRPTTTTSATTSSVTSVTEQTRSKVDEETLRLPTLKELVGLTTTAFTQTTSTTTRLIDATIDNKVSREESIVRGYRKDRQDVGSNDEPGVRTNLEDSQGHSRITKEKEISDNDILGSEEIQRRSSTTSFVKDEGQFPRTIKDEEDEKSKNEKTFRRVVPVTILDENNREEIAELVLLRVPENKLNSAILKPFFRVKIVEQDKNETRESIEKNVDNESQESSENELSENSRRISGKRKNEEIVEDHITVRNQPRNRQRIIKARRRIRPDNSNESNEQVENDRRSPGVRRFSRRRDNVDENPTTNVPEYFENSSTTVRATTMRGTFSTTVKSNETRGFYITRRSDETSTISESIAASFTLENPSARKTDLFVSTPEMESTTRKIVPTTEKIDFTTESDQTVDPEEKNDFTSFYESTTGIESEMTAMTSKENDSTSEQQFTTEKSETVTPYYDTTLDDRFIEPFGSSITTIEGNPKDDLAITTFRPWTHGPMFTTNPTTMNEFATTKYSLDDLAGVTEDLKVIEGEESTDSNSETLKTSENTHLSRAEFDENNVKTEYQPEALDVDNTTESSKTLSDEIYLDPKNEVETTTEFRTIAFETNTVDATLEQLEVRSTTVPIKITSDQGHSRTTAQTEKSSRRATNVQDKATTYKGALNRGRVRFSSKTKPSVLSSSPQGQARRTTQSFVNEDYRNNWTSQSETNPAIPTTESYDKIGRTIASDEENYSSTSSEERTRSRYPNSRLSLRGRYSSRKTTKSLGINKTGNESDEKRFDLESRTTTESYDEAIKTTQNEEPNYVTTTFEQRTRSPLSSSRSSWLRSVEIEKTSDVNPTTSTMDYLTTNFVEATGSETLLPENFNSPLATTISLDNDESTIDSTTEKEFLVTSIDIINDKVTESPSFTTKVDYPTTSFVETERSFTQPITDKIETVVTITENYDKFTDTINSMNDIVTEKTERDENNETESIAMYETTANYAETPLPGLDTDQTEVANADRKNETINFSNDVTTTNIELESLPLTTSSYVNNDRDEIITENIYARTSDRTTTDTTEIVRETTSRRDENNNAIEERTKEFYSTTLPSTIYKSDATPIFPNTKIEKIITPIITKSPPRELFAKRIRSTTALPILEDNSSTTIDSTNLVSSVTDRHVKRPRGRVRYVNFAGSGENESGKNRRPIKQVVVRRRPANNRQNVAIPEASKEISQTSKDEKWTNEYSQNNFASPLSDETLKNPVNSTKIPRRRVLVYRGRPRNETFPTTPSTTTTTTTTTTTVQSSSDEISEDRTRRRRKWRKRIVRKRGRVDSNEDDQSIAETRDLMRTSKNDELVDDLSDELAGSWLVAPTAGIVDSEEREDTGGEVNIYKSSGAFLRRPGTLLRTDAFNRARLKSVGTLVPATVPVSQSPAIFSKIHSTDPTEEIKTEDQSGRAQELAVTVADPPAIRSSTIGRLGLRKGTRKISTTIAPQAESVTTTARTTPIARRRSRPKSFADNAKIIATPTRPRRPAIIDYDYYVDEEVRLVLKPELKDKLYVTGKGGIKCLDQGNFAHPTSCKKFITCARMVNGQVVGTEYTCPDKLSFDPVGGICNWSAGLGCEEKSNPTG